MKNILLLFILTLTSFSCTQTNNTDKKNANSLSINTNRKYSLTIDTCKLTIFKSHYKLLLQGQKREVETIEQLSEILKNKYNRQDSLYIFIEDAFSDQVDDVMKTIHNLKVDKYRIIVTQEFYKLPYPDPK